MAPGTISLGPHGPHGPMSNAPDWKLKRRDAACVDCGKAFEEEEAFFSVLTIDAEGLGRSDHCVRCFGERPESRADVVFWRTRRQPEKKRGLAVDFEAIEALFLALVGREEVRLQELGYLLSLLLMRKRRLKLVRVRRSGEGETMVLRRPRREEELEVVVFDLTPERMDALRRELERIVEGAGAEDVLAGPPPAPETDSEIEAEVEARLEGDDEDATPVADASASDEPESEQSAPRA